MIPLAWVVNHGMLFLPACLLLALVLAVFVVHGRPRVAAFLATKRARKCIGRPRLEPLEEGAHVTLIGHIDASGSVVTRYEDGAEAALVSASSEDGGSPLRARAERLFLIAHGTRFVLQGPIELLSGSREARSGLPWKRQAATILQRAGIDRADGPEGRPVFRSISSSDVVRVTGILSQEAATEGHSYREAAAQWAIVGAGEPLRLAYEGQPKVTGPAPLRYVVTGFVAVAAVALCAVGLAAATVPFVDGALLALRFAPEQSFGTPTPTALAVALANPVARKEALLDLAAVLDDRRDPDPNIVALRLRTHELLGHQAAADLWVAHGDPAHGAELALAASDYRLAAEGFYLAGRFDRSSAALLKIHEPRDEEDLRFDVGIHLLAGRLGLAAHAAHVLARVYRRRGGEGDTRFAWLAERAENADCIWDVLSAGEAKAQPARLGSPDLTSTCQLLLADSLQGPHRLDLIRPIAPMDPRRLAVPKVWFDLLALEVDGSSSLPSFELHPARFLAVPSRGPVFLPAVERSLAFSSLGSGVAVASSRSRVAATAAVFAWLAGDDVSARALSRIHVDFAPARTSTAGSDLLALTGAQAFNPFTCSQEASALLDLGSALGRKGVQALLEHAPPPNGEEWRAFQLAASGDGEGLAAFLREPTSEPGTFLRFAAPIQRGREVLARQIRFGYRRPKGFHPVELLIQTVNLAVMAESLGDRSLAKDLRDRAGRFREALLRRETAVPLAVLERI